MLCRLPDGVFRAAGHVVDKCFCLIGDENPQFAVVSKQFSTADSVDLMREDYKDFDVTERYVDMVSELKGAC